MSLFIKPFILGPIQNNTYLLADTATSTAVVIDPSFNVQPLIETARAANFNIIQVWLTHAHFDHYAGLDEIKEAFPAVQVGLHPADQFLWDQGGLSELMNINLHPDISIDLLFEDNMQLNLGEQTFSVFHTPGHSPGHVLFYHPKTSSVFCGDLIFNQAIGRTDLPGGNYDTLIESIRSKVLSLPPETHLYSGHGPATTVQQESQFNPYL